MISVNIIRSNRKTLAIQINEDLSVTVRAPGRVSNQEIQRILQEKEPWIIKSMEKIKKNRVKQEDCEVTPLTDEQVQELVNQAKVYIPERVAYYAAVIGVDYGKVTIRKQKTRWGSCSAKGNLNFNCLLMLMPEKIIDYVVVHELCHRKEMNHAKAFWDEVAKILPDYKESLHWLKNEGKYIMKRMK